MQCVFAFEKRPDRGVLDDQAGFVQFWLTEKENPLAAVICGL
jgi:hypothetical protein